ncbi:A24 family peptidase [Polynucleobacter sp. MWH-UH35A]|uniref:prepilin peptidase n=1 Tax=Polynucleobacter sp. MWH-UH35A TaxID=1855619 RepID=UPI001BFE2CB2|nr:A24 family peptidase [Polynucleobacter sp. MWH-UH35A]QWD60308.1 prepilin peptidase [Polynucleobacter sp. MWH-UH35A]
MGNLALLDWVQICLILTLMYLAYIDLRTFRLPDVITYPLILSGLMFSGFSKLGFISFQDSVIGAALGYSALRLLNLLYRLVKKQDGVGMGDAKLLAALGAWFGWYSLPSILLIASLSGLIGGFIWLQWNKQSHHSAFPFGPFLAFAGIIELLWPQTLQTLLLSKLA